MTNDLKNRIKINGDKMDNEKMEKQNEELDIIIAPEIEFKLEYTDRTTNIWKCGVSHFSTNGF